MFEVTPQNFPRKIQSNNEFQLCKENEETKSISSSAPPLPTKEGS